MGVHSLQRDHGDSCLLCWPGSVGSDLNPVQAVTTAGRQHGKTKQPKDMVGRMGMRNFPELSGIEM